MSERRDLGIVGLTAVLTAGGVAGALAVTRGGPCVSHGPGVLSWFEANLLQARAGVLLWLGAMVALVAFATRFRETLWRSHADRGWLILLFVQGAVVFAATATCAGAGVWMLADQAAAGSIDAPLAGALWGFTSSLLRFASLWLFVPIAVVSVVLYQHSTMGQVTAVAGTLVAVGLLTPLSWQLSMGAFVVWLGLVATTLFVPSPAARAAARPPVGVPHP